MSFGRLISKHASRISKNTLRSGIQHPTIPLALLRKIDTPTSYAPQDHFFTRYMSTNRPKADRQGPTIYYKNDASHPSEFTCDEEPHMLGMQHGGPIGYIPLQLGQVFEDLEGGQYEIVRKLGWATNSSVWLAKHTRYVSCSSTSPIHSILMLLY